MFWDNYVALCSKKGKSPNAVASELGKSSGSVTAWKGGTVPRETTLKKIADYFGVSIDQLLYDQKEKSPTPEGMEPFEGYSTLTMEEREKVKDYIALLLAARQTQ